jgi:hypothetical protein
VDFIHRPVFYLKHNISENTVSETPVLNKVRIIDNVEDCDSLFIIVVRLYDNDVILLRKS